MNNTHFALLENQAFALMGRMHVILRRQSGRVTDIEYMRIDPGYCRHLLDLASQQPNEDLQQIVAKLAEIYFGPDGLFVAAPPKPPLLARLAGAAAPATATASAPAAPMPQPAEAVPPSRGADHGEAVDKTYIGRLR
jgi:hypothetical protein